MAITKDYRLVKKNNVIAIHEVIYDEQDNPTMLTTDPVFPTGSTFSEVATNLRKYAAAIQKPVLEYRLIVKSNKPDGTATS